MSFFGPFVLRIDHSPTWSNCIEIFLKALRCCFRSKLAFFFLSLSQTLVSVCTAHAPSKSRLWRLRQERREDRGILPREVCHATEASRVHHFYDDIATRRCSTFIVWKLFTSNVFVVDMPSGQSYRFLSYPSVANLPNACEDSCDIFHLCTGVIGYSVNIARACTSAALESQSKTVFSQKSSHRVAPN